MALYPVEFRPNATSDLIRIGAPYDGGYVLPERIIFATHGILSFGLSDEWEFEDELSHKSGARVVCFDPSVTWAFWLRKFVVGIYRGLLKCDAQRFRRGLRFFDYVRFFDGQRHKHYRKAIGYPGVRAISLPQAIELAQLDEPLFLKMDIEGWEYRLLSDLIVLQHRFVGFAIEFHDVDLHEERIRKFISAINDTFLLVHFHANSHTAIRSDGSALVVEMSFMNRALLKPGEVLEYRDLPIPRIDAPNLPNDVEAIVSFHDVA